MATTKFAGLEGDPVPKWLSEPPIQLGEGETLLAVEAEALTAGIDPLEMGPLADPRAPGSPALRIRKNQVDLGANEWNAFVRALEAIAADDAASPSWQDLVQVHINAMADVGMNWGVHHMGMSMPGEGRNFLAWHRAYLTAMEERLREVEPDVTIPYWNWVNERQIPSALSGPSPLQQLGVTRYPSSESLPVAGEIQALLQAPPDYLRFQEDLEEGPHNAVHRFVAGGTIGGWWGADRDDGVQRPTKRSGLLAPPCNGRQHLGPLGAVEHQPAVSPAQPERAAATVPSHHRIRRGPAEHFPARLHLRVA